MLIDPMAADDVHPPNMGVSAAVAATTSPAGPPTDKIDILSIPDMSPPRQEKQTARKGVRILVETGTGFVEPSGLERRAIAVGFAMAGKVVYGAAFDVVRSECEVDLSDATSIFENISAITLFEIKSTNKAAVREDFGGYFFDLTTAELLVAQSLGKQYRFAFVNTITGAHIELSLNELFARARKIYPKWAVTF